MLQVFPIVLENGLIVGGALQELLAFPQQPGQGRFTSSAFLHDVFRGDLDFCAARIQRRLDPAELCLGRAQLCLPFLYFQFGYAAAFRQDRITRKLLAREFDTRQRLAHVRGGRCLQLLMLSFAQS